MAPHGVIQLLNSVQGHPLQTWRIEDRSHVTIGRAEDNDVVVSDPYVSRAHAYLQFDYGQNQWRLISISRHQIVHQGQTVGELPLVDGTVFRLGQHGCYLRFNHSLDSSDIRKTMSYDTTLMPVFVLDKQKLERDVKEIVEGDYFQSLKDAADRQRRQKDSADTKVS